MVPVYPVQTVVFNVKILVIAYAVQTIVSLKMVLAFNVLFSVGVVMLVVVLHVKVDTI